MEQHLDWNPDLPLASIEDFIDPRILEDRIWEPNFELTETESTSSAGSQDVLSLSSGYETDPKYEMLRSENSEIDDYSLSDYSCEDESTGVSVLDERVVESSTGRTYQYLVKCWIDEKHLTLFNELIRLS
ncbi:hypothetical protein CNMCM8980_005207 [Aspergillus fumigatiaffinis]|nr:hypothetical protein CNMCM8980_005207 [Aspergillus fumigatiaffinis]